MRISIFGLALFSPLFFTACSEAQLPTIGRTMGDVPMNRLIAFDSDKGCYRFLKNVSFEAPFADGMAYQQTTCLTEGKKIGRKKIEDIAQLHVSLTSDGEYFIVKDGY